jgi:hypothetical protein
MSDYTSLKRTVGEPAAERLEDAVLHCLAGARTSESLVALLRLQAVLMAATAHRAIDRPDIADQCVAEFSTALRILRAS